LRQTRFKPNGPILFNEEQIYIYERYKMTKEPKILYIEDGRLTGAGNHEDLVATNATYRELCALQEQKHITEKSH